MKARWQHRTSMGSCALAGILFSFGANMLDAAPPKDGAPRSSPPTDIEIPTELGEVIRETIRKGQYEVDSLSPARAVEQPLGFTAYEARNRRHHFHASFGEAGLHVRPLDAHNDGWEFGLSLVSVGFADDPQNVADPVLTTRENTIEFHRQDIAEWYVNDEFGLEQGFTLNSPPLRSEPRALARADSDVLNTLEVRLTLTGKLAAELIDGGSAVLLRDEFGTGVLRVKDLFAFDATGRSLPAEFALDGSQLVLVVDAEDARFPVTIDPLIVTEQAKLTPSDAGAGDEFGWAVGLSSDTAVVGARKDDGAAGIDQGSAYVFERSGTVWSQQAKLTAADAAAGDEFGRSVSLSGDTVLLGAAEDDDGGASSGSVYVFVRSGALWSQQAKLTSADAAADDHFGVSVALSGERALVGADKDDSPFSNQGSAYLFMRSGTSWSQEQKLTASDGAAGDNFGGRVALSGNTLVVGAHLHDVPVGAAGAAYVFVKTGGNWSQQQKLTAGDAEANGFFGWSVALSGETALIGAYQADGLAAENAGAAYVWVRSGSVWSEQAKLSASDGAFGDAFGLSVALDGNTALVGAIGGPGNTDQGSAYVYFRSGNNWSEQQKLTASDGAADDVLGRFVALSGDTALVGAPQDDGTAGADQGAAYVFTRSGSVWSEEAKLTPASDAAADDTLGRSVALDGDTALLGAPEDNGPAGTDQGSAYVFVRNGTVWSQQAKLTAADAAAADYFGGSVALSGDTALMGAVGDDISLNHGSAYMFVRSGTSWSQQQKLTVSGGSQDVFARALAVSGDTALVTGNDNTHGWVNVYVRSGTVWSGQAVLLADDAASGDFFGGSVAIHGDTALVGAPGNDDACPEDSNCNSGSAYVFTRSGTAWSQQAKLIANDDAAGDEFGIAVALSGDTALAGAASDDGAFFDQGSAYVFVRNGTAWSQQAKLTADDAEEVDYAFGSAVAVSGGTALVGDYGDTGPAGNLQGSAYVFVRSGTFWSQQAKLTPTDAAAGDGFGNSVAVSGSTALVGSVFDDGPAGGNQGSAYVFTIEGCECQLYGDVVSAFCVVDVDDLLYVLDSFADPISFPDGDIEPCSPDGDVDVDDLLAELDAFSGIYDCPHPCPP